MAYDATIKGTFEGKTLYRCSACRKTFLGRDAISAHLKQHRIKGATIETATRQPKDDKPAGDAAAKE